MSMRIRRRYSAIIVGVCVALMIYSPVAAINWGVVWQRDDTGNLAFYTPDYIKYWRGYQYQNVYGGWGRHIYASADPYWQDQATNNQMWNNWVNSGYTRMPAISFNEQNVNGQAHTGLHATGWFYTSYGSSTFWSGDDNGDGRQEEAKVRWEPFYNQGANAVFEVEFWDANYNGVDTATKTQAKVNVSAYWVTNHGWIQDNRHLGAFCVNQYDGFWSC